MKTFILVFLLHTFLFGIAFGNAAEPFKIKKDGMIDVDINNLPLNDTLRNLSGKISLELKGNPVGSEPINLSISNISLDEMLKRMMRGYNYVLIRPDNSGKSILMVLGKAERTKYTDAPSVTVTAAPPPPAVTAPPVQQPMVASMPQQQPNSPGASQMTTLPQPSASATGGVSSSGAISSAAISGAGSRTIPVEELLIPPMPPHIAGFDLPPMPPGFTTATSQASSTPPAIPSTSASTSTPTSTSTSTSTSQTASTPPAIPSTSSATSTTTSTSQTKPDLDLRPPSMPF